MDEGSSELDILEQDGGSRLPRLPLAGWRPTRAASILAACTLVAGLVVGYVVGFGHGRGTVAAPTERVAPTGQASAGVATETFVATPPSAAIYISPALTENPGTCSVQVGHNLELGIPVTNLSADTVLLQSAKPIPLASGMLKVLSWRWDPCGYDDDGIAPDTVALGPGETTWVTAVVRPLIACPAPVPLQFKVTYSINSLKSTFNLPGFPDLSAVHYSGCPAQP